MFGHHETRARDSIGPRAVSERFSLMVLEDGEYYFKDAAAFHYASTGRGETREKGRLKLCSRSVIFVPDDDDLPIIKFPFRDTITIHKFDLPLTGPLARASDMFVIVCTQVVSLKENNQDAPYLFEKSKKPVEHRFSLSYVALDVWMAQVGELFNAAKLPPNQMEGVVRAAIARHEEGVVFNTSWLQDLSERPLLEVTASRVSPLVMEPGRLVLTDHRIYFQAFSQTGSHLVQKWHLADVTRALPRRHMLRQCGVEIFFKGAEEGETVSFARMDDGDGDGDGDGLIVAIFFAFGTSKDRDKFIHTLMEIERVKMPNLHEEPLSEVTKRWRHGELSNFDYLTYLNEISGRTVNDLTQYPVFPWVICDYESDTLDLSDPTVYRDLSKPIGALNPSRLEAFKERYASMPDEPGHPRFLYGTHYSTPGYVLYYLVRVKPECMLRLQNGRFDTPDRIFNSIAETWRSVTTLTSDLKELIPAFYMPECAHFLHNTKDLPFGTMQNGQKVNNVVLPPWAADGKDMIRTLRNALESDHVSTHLHEWIDLIFGYKQQGEEALRADNLFHPHTYEGSVDIDSIDNPIDRAAMEMQISEFGQCPAQLFGFPHPPRLIGGDGKTLVGSGSGSGSGSSVRMRTTATTHTAAHTPPLHPHPTPPTTTPTTDKAKSADTLDANVNALAMMGRTVSIPPSVVPLEDLLADLNASNDAVEGAVEGDWMTTLCGMKCKMQQRTHKDIVSGIALSPNGDTLYTTSQDMSLKFFSLSEMRQLRSASLCDMALSGCVVTADNRHLIVSSWDNCLHTYSIDFGAVTQKTAVHDDAVSCLAMNGKRDLIVTASWDSVVRLWGCDQRGDISKLPMGEFLEQDSEITCVGIDESAIVSGAADGMVCVWDVNTGHVLCSGMPHTQAVTGAVLSSTASSTMLISCSNDHTVRVFDLRQGLEHTVVAIDTGDALTCLQANLPSPSVDGAVAVVGSEHGNVTVWDLFNSRDIAHYRENDRDRGISCLKVSNDGNSLYYGTQDGSVRVYSNL